MDAHDDDDDDGNENIAKDEFCVLSNFININFVKCRQFLLELNPEEKGNFVDLCSSHPS